MAYEPQTTDEIRDALLASLRSRVNGADVSESSEWYARASAFALVIGQMHYGLRWVERQIFPDSADSANLRRHAALYGLTPNAATAASAGVVRLIGTVGTVVSSGLTAVHADGTAFITEAGGTVNGFGFVDVASSATTTGTVGNKAAGDELELDVPPSGIQSTITVTTAFSGGTDDESDAELLTRLLTRMQDGSAGGTAADWEAWAMSVDGVMAADCLATRLGPGTVTLAVYTEGVGGYRAAAGIDLRNAVSAYLETVRPVTCEVDVCQVTEQALDVTCVILEYEDGYDEATVRSEVEAAIEAHIYSLITGETARRTRIGKAISAVAGVMDYRLDAPAVNVASTVSSTAVHVFIPGTITVS